MSTDNPSNSVDEGLNSETDDSRFMTYAEFESFASTLTARSELANRAGQQFDGKRDIQEAAGYPEKVDYETSKDRFERQDIAGAIVDSYPSSTWKQAPEVIADKNEFVEEVQKLFDSSQELQLDRSVLHYFKRADTLARLGQYSVLFLGWSDADDSEDLEEEVNKGDIDDLNDLMYMTPVPEPNVEIGDKVSNPGDTRFGKPEFYRIEFDELNRKVKVHWSRVIHIAEGVLEDPLRGRPVLERTMNRLQDLEKILAAAGEGAWTAANPGFQIDVDKDLHGEVDTEGLEEQVEEYDHKMRRFVKTWGSDINEISAETIDPANPVDTNIKMIAGALEIPKRKLIGSERGDLASSQDEAAWYEKVKGRQQNFAEPVVLRPFIDRLSNYGALPAIEHYEVDWPNLFELTQLEKAQLALQLSQAISTAAPAGDPATVVTPEEIREQLLGWKPELGSESTAETAEEIAENLGADPDDLDTDQFEELVSSMEGRFEPGDRIKRGPSRGIVLEVVTHDFELEGEKHSASEESPAYVIATEGGRDIVTAEELKKEDWSEDVPDEESDPEKAKQAKAANVYSEALEAGIDPNSEAFIGYAANAPNPGLGFDSWPPSWRKSDKPARLILLDAWVSMGATFRGCVREMGPGNRNKRFCAAMKDEVYLTEDWRGGLV